MRGREKVRACTHARAHVSAGPALAAAAARQLCHVGRVGTDAGKDIAAQDTQTDGAKQKLLGINPKTPHPTPYTLHPTPHTLNASGSPGSITPSHRWR